MNRKQSIQLKSIKNARELGGYAADDGREIKYDLLLRTAKLNEISNEDICKLKDSYRVNHIIDFRMPMEQIGADDPTIEGAQYHHLDIIDMDAFFSQGIPDIDINTLDPFAIAEMTIQSGLQNENMYIGFLTCDTGKKSFAEFFRILLAAEPDRAVLWHCTGGKDRTGLAAMLLLSALGVDEKTIIYDYLLTNAYNDRSIAETRQSMQEKGYDEVFIEQAILIYDAVDERYMRNAIDYLKKQYGSVLGYILDELNISHEELEALKNKYLQ